MTEWLLLLVALVLVAGNAVFVAAEFSFITVDRATVERRAEEGDARSASLLRALRSLSTQLSGAQLGITVTSLLVGFIAEPSLATLLRGPLGLTGLSDGAVTAVAITVALAVASAFQMVFGELVPKNWAIAEPLRVGRVVAAPQRGFTTATGWLLRLLNGTANAILRAVGIEPVEELASARSPAELSSLVERSGHEGSLDTGTAELVSRSIAFGGRTAADVMTPRPRVTFLSADQPVADVLSAAATTGHARFPVHDGGVDHVVGVVHFKHALGVPAPQRAERSVRDVMVEIAAVPASMELDPLLTLLRRPGLQLAVVVDEFGGTAGVVTLEDLVEEIVGEITDEQDRPVARLHRSPDGSWQLSGLLRPDEASALTGLDLPEGEQTDTLGGLLAERLGRLPVLGDSVEVEAGRGGAVLSAARLDGRRVDRVRLRPTGASVVSDDDVTAEGTDEVPAESGEGRS